MPLFKSLSPVTTSPVTLAKKAGALIRDSSAVLGKYSFIASSNAQLFVKQESGIYSLDADEVKRVINLVINDKPYNVDQFLFYHRWRNYFNVKNEVTKLTKAGDGVYKDNIGYFWQEVSTAKNMFHMPKTNYLGHILKEQSPIIEDIVPIDPLYSRKFLRPDNTIQGIGGEFEMIIRHDGKRIDAMTDVKYQETYNFARTYDKGAHTKLDMVPHLMNGNYMFRKDMGSVVIIE